jgi:hypothetical protein
MSRLVRFTLVVVMLIALLPVRTALADNGPADADAVCKAHGGSFGGTQPGGATFCVWMPAAGKATGDLVVFAHGYVDPRVPAGEIPWGQLLLPDQTTSLPGLVTAMGFAFAITSYRQNGLAIQEGVQDILELVTILQSLSPVSIKHIYLTGASEGGLVTALAVEQNPGVFTAGLSTCGPIGDFNAQIKYWGDFRVVYDYFFPTIHQTFDVPLGGSPVNIPGPLLDAWGDLNPTPFTPLKLGVLAELKANPLAFIQLLRVTKAPIDWSSQAAIDSSTVQTVLGLLGYNFVATNQGIAELGGQPYFNQAGSWLYRYQGSFNDAALNAAVFRTEADPAALQTIKDAYQTSGKLSIPLITLHTTGDPIVPYIHETLYNNKVWKAGSIREHINIPIFRYGHCNFKPAEVLFGFWVMVLKSTLFRMPISTVQSILPDAEAQAEFNDLVARYERGTLENKVYLPHISH